MAHNVLDTAVEAIRFRLLNRVVTIRLTRQGFSSPSPGHHQLELKVFFVSLC
jgi:hypothetical protein